MKQTKSIDKWVEAITDADRGRVYVTVLTDQGGKVMYRVKRSSAVGAVALAAKPRGSDSIIMATSTGS